MSIFEVYEATMLKIKSVFASVFFIVSVFSISVVQASDRAPKRFDSWLDALEKSLLCSPELPKVAVCAASGDARALAFHLQALTSLYSGEDKKFDKMRRNFKELEDQIGDFDKWNEILKFARKNQSDKDKIQEISEKRDAALIALQELLTREEWVGANPQKSPRIEKYRDFLKDYNWESYEKDRKFVLSQIRKQLKKVGSTSYDMGTLEQGNGLHELRREIRWFLIQARSLDGLVVLRAARGPEKDQACPAAEAGESKYAKLPGNKGEETPCRVQRCPFFTLVQTVADLGEVKDESERTLNSANPEHVSDRVSPELKKKADAIYSGFQNTRSIETLIQDIKACEDK